MSMYHAIYHSRRVARRPSDLDDIIDTAQRNNAMLGVTGVLLVDGDHFVQLLEGRRAVLTGLLARILNDDRHTQCELALFERTSIRLFSGWSMRPIRLSDAQRACFEAGGVDMDDPGALSGQMLWDLMVTISESDAQAAVAQA